jgi:hypothetical protein
MMCCKSNNPHSNKNYHRMFRRRRHCVVAVRRHHSDHHHANPITIKVQGFRNGSREWNRSVTLGGWTRDGPNIILCISWGRNADPRRPQTAGPASLPTPSPPPILRSGTFTRELEKLDPDKLRNPSADGADFHRQNRTGETYGLLAGGAGVISTGFLRVTSAITMCIHP